MVMKCWLIYDENDELRSIAHDENGTVEKAQVVADPLPDGWGETELDRVPNLAEEEWDKATRNMKAIPPRKPTRREVLVLKDPASLTEAEKIELMQYVAGRPDRPS